jgi:hypothetical protein
MKNMSFGKFLALFGGFFLLVIVVALVAVKAAGHKKSGPETVIKHKVADASPDAGQTPAPTTQPPAEPPQPSQMVAPAGAATNAPTQTSTDMAVQMSQGSGNQNTVPQTAALAAANPAQPNNARIGTTPNPMQAPSVPMAAMPPQPAAPSADAMRIVALETTVKALQDRLASLETGKSAHAETPVRHTARRLPADAALPVRTGYRTDAVVGGRAFLSLPDGSQNSALVGENLPQPVRLQAASRDSGVVVISSQERLAN